MASSLHGLSNYDPTTVPSASDMVVGIVVSDYNPEITTELLHGACQTLINHGMPEKEIIIEHVPGAFEITLGAQLMAKNFEVDAVICLGCVVKGETEHDYFINSSVANGLTDLNLSYGIPFIFGLLTTNTFEQARERAGGKLGNKGDEAAITAIKMIALQRSIEQ